jgi:hypothetical protein
MNPTLVIAMIEGASALRVSSIMQINMGGSSLIVPLWVHAVNSSRAVVTLGSKPPTFRLADISDDEMRRTIVMPATDVRIAQAQHATGDN